MERPLSTKSIISVNIIIMKVVILYTDNVGHQLFIILHEYVVIHIW